MDPAAEEHPQEAQSDLQGTPAEEPEPSTSRYPPDFRYIDWPTSLQEKLTRQDLYSLANGGVDEWSLVKPLEPICTEISGVPKSYTLGQGAESCTVYVGEATIKNPGTIVLEDPWHIRQVLCPARSDRSVFEELALEATNFTPMADESMATVDEMVQFRLTAWWESLCAANTCAGSKQPRKTNAPTSEYSSPEAGVTVHSKGTIHPKIDNFVYWEQISAKEWLKLRVLREAGPSTVDKALQKLRLSD